MTERPTVNFDPGRPVDRLEEPERRAPWRRAVVIGVVVALAGTGALTKVLTHHSSAHASPGAPARLDPRTNRQHISSTPEGVSSAGRVTARGRIGGSVTAGDTLVFDVSLSSNRFFSLHPCPVYTITFGRHTTTRHLSCGHVPYLASLVRPDGSVTGFQPALPAGTVVIFRMQVRVPDRPGRQRVQWALHGPRPRAVLSGVVDVAAPGPG